jgi:hypothetical protein
MRVPTRAGTRDPELQEIRILWLNASAGALMRGYRFSTPLPPARLGRFVAAAIRSSARRDRGDVHGRGQMNGDANAISTAHREHEDKPADIIR